MFSELRVAELRARLHIVNALGLHARAAAKLAECASQFKSRITLAHGDECVDATGVMGLLLLCAHHDAWVDVHACGEDAHQAIDALRELFAAKFGELA